MAMEEIMLRQAEGPKLIRISRDLFREYEQAIGTNLEYQGFSAELAALSSPYSPPAGALLLAQAEHEVAGCVALRALDDQTAEMKRLYVRPAFRGYGLGKRLVNAVIRLAREAGYSELRLDTLASMVSAQALYEQIGFVETPPYNNKYLPGTRFYTLKLVA